MTRQGEYSEAASRRARDPIGRELSALKQLDTYALQVRWRRTFGRSPPAHLTRPLLLRILAYRIQAEAYGDLEPATVRMLDRLARDAAKAGASGRKTSSVRVPPVEEARGLKHGTVLVREHGGELHRVTVVSGGFAWQGQTFTSLSEVARAITGTRWNGPRFFGLRSGKGRGGAPGEQAEASA